MRWRKLDNWLPQIEGFTHAAMPFYFEGEIYFSPRDYMGKSHTYVADFNPKTLSIGKPRPYLTPGKAGDYDDYGCMVSWVKRDGPRVLCYFIGWNIGVNIPFRNSIGLAIDGHKLYGPLKDRDLYDPYGVGSCCDGLRYYLSVLGWEKHDLRPRARYHIVNGHPHSVAITFKDPHKEWAIARPCVIGDEMWYCYRGAEYRIGYATQKDGIWTRRDEEAGIDVSESGFDCDAVCYPHVFDYEGSRYMLYNGGGYGKTGFGLAVFD